MRCPTCGNDMGRPMAAHRFTEGERVISIAGMSGIVLKRERWGCKIAWDNGYEGFTSPLALDHAPKNS